jgi:hypothetical protein
LLDDPGAEPDSAAQTRFLKTLTQLPCQCLVTLPGNSVPDAEIASAVWFHVKRGEIAKMVEFRAH